MDNISQYYGVVTLELYSKNKKRLISRQFNEGTVNLFSAYAAALAGQNISNLIPNSIDIGEFNKKDGAIIADSFMSVLNTSGALASVVYVSDTNDESYKKYDTPYTRVTATFTRNMGVSNVTKEHYLVLKSFSNKVLAVIHLNESLVKTLRQLTSGSQFIVVWDLYVTNKTA